MRLFTGIAIPAEVTSRLGALLDHLRGTASIRWSPVYNMHITTKFIGEWPETRLDELVNALQPLGVREPFSVHVGGMGWLPNPHSPRILFAGIDAGEPLAKLASDTEAVLEPLGIARETRPFRAHLTLARIDTGVPLAPLRQAIAQLESTDFGTFTVAGFCLYLSKPGPAGSIYTQLSDIRLTR